MAAAVTRAVSVAVGSVPIPAGTDSVCQQNPYGQAAAQCSGSAEACSAEPRHCSAMGPWVFVAMIFGGWSAAAGKPN